MQCNLIANRSFNKQKWNTFRKGRNKSLIKNLKESCSKQTDKQNINFPRKNNVLNRYLIMSLIQDGVNFQSFN